jgi:CheY-like chemotaxis protein
MYRHSEKRILVVDDDEGVRSLLINSLGAMGYQVDAAADGQEAFGLWGANAYGLVISDVIYFHSGGIDLVNRIRQEDAEVPIVVITGYGQEIAQEALDAGADHVLMKPFHLFQVRDIVEKLIG